MPHLFFRRRPAANNQQQQETTMLIYLIKRILMLIPLMFGITLITFAVSIWRRRTGHMRPP
jgi:hypothetical protein